ncbi:hypothetical protein CGZ75_08005 [Paenibacillus herberti]|uniref:Transposase n=1 Tax=Paenibacillus herberti TaxID=1619309 RepID=A0A229P2W6_9BACL|nr:hypothetical protein CGZ75_08005 [Paenibacillus herberti]
MMLNATLWIARTDAAWCDLQDFYGFWKSLYTRFRRCGTKF